MRTITAEDSCLEARENYLDDGEYVSDCYQVIEIMSKCADYHAIQLGHRYAFGISFIDGKYDDRKGKYILFHDDDEADWLDEADWKYPTWACAEKIFNMPAHPACIETKDCNLDEYCTSGDFMNFIPPTCISLHYEKVCFDSQLYWIDLQGEKTDLIQDCGSDITSNWSSEYECGNDKICINREIIEKGCAYATCYETISEEEKIVGIINNSKLVDDEIIDINNSTQDTSSSNTSNGITTIIDSIDDTGYVLPFQSTYNKLKLNPLTYI
ncbi:MAG: hypothetical protein GWP19_14190, partial [Planctomycetia bacterium]|nr:hypothetical protein [Planctomycetia bacterium]